MTDQEILKLIQSKEQVLKENLLHATEAEEVQKSLVRFLDEHLPDDSIIGLRYRKLKTDKRLSAWWRGTDGYPLGNTWVEKFEPFIKILEQYLAEKTIKRRLEVEGLFIESRKQGENSDEHLIIGKKDDAAGEKAHIIIDSNTGEIRVEEGRKEPTELIRHIETILTLPGGKRIKSSREAIEELAEEEKVAPDLIKIELDKEPAFNPMTTTKEGLAHSFILMVSILIKNLSDQKVNVRNINAKLTLPQGYQNGMFFTDLRNTEALEGKDFISRTLSFKAEIINGANGALNDENIVWTENKNKVLEHLASTPITLDFKGEYVALDGTRPLSTTFDITTMLLSKIKK